MRDVVTASTADLVRRGQTGDKGAFGQLVERFQEEAYGLAYYHLGHREDALDVAQQAFLAAYLHLDSLTDPARFGGWLARIVANECCVGIAGGVRHSLSMPRLWAICRMGRRCPRSTLPSTASCTGTSTAPCWPCPTTAPGPHAVLRGRPALPPDCRDRGTTHHHGQGAHPGRTQASAAHPRAYV